MPDPGVVSSSGSSGSYGGYPGAYGTSSSGGNSYVDTSSLSGIEEASRRSYGDSSSVTAPRPDTSSLTGIEALSRQPSSMDALRNSATTTDRLASPANEDDSPPIGAIAAASAWDSGTRTAPVSPESRSRNSIDAAAFDGLEVANPRSIQNNLEYGGLVYQNPATGRYSASNPISGTVDGFNPGDVTVPSGSTVVGDYHTHGDYSEVDDTGAINRTTNPSADDFNSDGFSQPDFDGISADGKGVKDYTGYLGTPGGEYRRYDPASDADTRMSIPGETVRSTARGGAATGAAVELGLSTYSALSDGLDRADIGTIANATAQGGGAGAAQAVGEHYAERVIDRAIGPAVQRNATAVAAATNVADDVAAGTGARVIASRVGGAGAVGAVVGAGFSIYENREGLANGDSDAIGDVAGDTVVAAGSALAGAATGAAIGSVVPVLGTAVGAVVGLGVGIGVDYVMRRGGVDDIVGDAVSSGVDAAKGAGKKIASFFGW